MGVQPVKTTRQLQGYFRRPVRPLIYAASVYGIQFAPTHLDGVELGSNGVEVSSAKHELGVTLRKL
jgi:hypothetical protein